jgi:PBP1b-binding outer membrane lipoprotein LpoB
VFFMRISHTLMPLLAATLFITGCGNEEPATNAVTQAEAAIEPLRPDASQYAAAELQAAEATLAKMKENLAKEDYRAVVNDVPAFNTQVKTLQDTVVSQQSAMVAAQHEWDSLNAEVPKTVEALQVRVDSLSGAKLPKEITKETFETAKTDFEALKATWAEATAAASAGKTLEAADKARDAQAKGEELKNQLGMNPALAAVSPPAGADVTP